MKRTACILLSVSSIGFAFSATQTNWFAGPGLPGPVQNWGNSFHTANSVSWLNQIGELSLASQEHLVTNELGNVCSICSADIDQDGDDDIVSSTHWFENSGGTWTPHLLGTGDWFVCAEDVDGDGDQDIVRADNDNLTWLENGDGLGISWITHSITAGSSGPLSPLCSDVDGDNDIDVIHSSYSSGSNKLCWWENLDGSGLSWAMHEVSESPNYFSEAAAGDIDGDGDADFAVASHSYEVTWLRNENGSGTEWLSILVDDDFDSALHVVICDLDGDGDMDIAGGGTGEDTFSWWDNQDGAGLSWAKAVITGSADHCSRLASGDPDGDGDTDLLGSTGLDGLFLWMENSGTGYWVERIVCNAGDYTWTDNVCVADLDGDGVDDLIGALPSPDNKEIRWWIVPFSTGSLTSSIYQTASPPDWADIQWNAEEPAGSQVGFQVRASDDYTAMGEWSDTLWSSGTSLSGILEDGADYMQYRAVLKTTTMAAQPVLHDVTLNWTYTGIAGSQNDRFIFEGPRCNPVSGSVVLYFNLAENCCVTVSLFDSAGRMVRNTSGSFASGEGQIEFTDLQPGIYHAIMKSGGISATERVTVMAR